MIPLVIICNDRNLGDSICALAAIQVLAEQNKDRHIYLNTCNPETELLMRPPNVRKFGELAGRQQVDFALFDIGRSFGPHGRYAHPIKQYFDQVRIPWASEEMPVPYYHLSREYDYATNKAVEPNVPIYDFLIAPHSDDLMRAWPIAKCLEFVKALKYRYGDATIAIIGGVKDFRFKDLQCEYGWYIENVIRMMLRARKAVITVDSGPNRVAHLAGIRNHVLLHPTYLPEVWTQHPGAILVPGTPDDWDVLRILEAVELAEERTQMKKPLGLT